MNKATKMKEISPSTCQCQRGQIFQQYMIGDNLNPEQAKSSTTAPKLKKLGQFASAQTDHLKTPSIT